MLWAVWQKIFRDIRWQLLLSSLLLFAFAWLFVWLSSLIKLGLWTAFLDMLPDFVNRLLPISPKQLATIPGRISIIFVHIVPMVILLAWALRRGAEVVGGEIESGRFEVLLTLPLPRWTWVAFPGMTTMLGGLVLVGCLYVGIEVGRATVEFPQEWQTDRFGLAAFNLFAMSFALAGIAAVFSACSRSRWTAISAAGTVFILAMILKLVARMWPKGRFLEYLSFLTLFEPQVLIFAPNAERLALWYNGGLMAIGLAGYALAAAILSRRDIPLAR